MVRDDLADAGHANFETKTLESDDEMEWEEVDVLQDDPKDSGLPTQNVEVILEQSTQKQKKRVGGDPVQRKLRLEAHKTHTVALLASFSLRNRWINDPLLHARLLSLTPLPLQMSFSMIHKKTEPDASRRTRLFQTACFKLTEWWQSFFHVIKGKGMRSRTFLEVETQRIQNEKQSIADLKGKGKVRTANSEEPPWSDRVRSAKSLMKHALLQKGSADTSALLFTALCRALDVPARLVVSLQSVPWSSKSETLKTDVGASPLHNGGTQDEVIVRKKRSRPRDRNARVVLPRASSTEPPLEGWPPVIWTEVFSRPEGRWIPIDPIRYLVDKKKLFEPPANCRVNRMMYVVAFEEDGYARDVTLRYAKEFAAKTAKARALTKRGQSEWWQRIISMLTRPYRLHRDDVEDGELESLQYIEGMPTSINGFKDHPIYALERHLRRDEIIHPMKEIGIFRGEPVYSRSSVQRVRTAETWIREGKVIREGQQPLKRIVKRAHTINRKRALELAKTESPEVPTLGVYAEWQTELYVPEPVVDGRIPKNDFGNINLFVSSMLPAGAVHLPFQGISKVAKEIGIDFAPAVTGFEFRKGHANPIISGIVVAEENQELIVSAYWESVQANQEAENLKRRERVLRRWSKLILGLQVRKRLQEEYGGSENKVDEAETPQVSSDTEAHTLRDASLGNTT
ncbi:related to xeroderma pigmentosum group C complementing factor (homolog to excision repair protein RAD4) [Serendipita indica DSM 11827]|uniref:Related to xeroderma pigmentosum group C complementing factor (Homolog to excision repair protein RAD4) n=1 Tax=Serendipita indica (strain DSM 11827) TaxID=1109443 RepID=G4TH60_SERID|nr:related to xeroderma pigmentosum group C complementing factor (homolog to excision repair protein RAD4) [Serendipita indica DSM 11827]